MHTTYTSGPRRVEHAARLLLCTCCARSGLHGFEAPGPNLAVGKPYSLSTAPSYPLCKDAGRGACWNPYTAPTPRWSPVFISNDGIHDTKHWEAFREGLEDYEYLAMLRDQIADAEA